MKTIKTYLWFDSDAVEVAQTYAGMFQGAQMGSPLIMRGTPQGDTAAGDLRLPGLDILAFSLSGYFKFNPAGSLIVSCRTKEEVDHLHRRLMEGGRELMPLGAYPFSPWYAWVEDKYGLSWQIILIEGTKSELSVRPALMFSGVATGRAEEAMDFYASVFPGSEAIQKSHYEEGGAPDKRAKLAHGSMTINGVPFILQDNGMPVDYTFNEAFSLMVLCFDQAEIDRLWAALSHVPEAEQCGWLKDKFGVSWQIVPHNLYDILFTGTKEEIARVTEAFMPMKKIDIAALEKAKRG